MKKQKQTPKLSLDKETVQSLSQGGLTKVRGGYHSRAGCAQAALDWLKNNT